MPSSASSKLTALISAPAPNDSTRPTTLSDHIRTSASSAPITSDPAASAPQPVAAAMTKPLHTERPRWVITRRPARGRVPGQGACNRAATGRADGRAMAGPDHARGTQRRHGRRLWAMVAGGAAGAPVGTWTVLFTDQVGSTEMRVRVGEGAFDAIRADLDARVAAALATHGVVVTKSTGDGVMGGFSSTAAAL